MASKFLSHVLHVLFKVSFWRQEKAATPSVKKFTLCFKSKPIVKKFTLCFKLRLRIRPDEDDVAGVKLTYLQATSSRAERNSKGDRVGWG